MTKDEAMKLALRSIRELVVDESDDASALQGVRMRKQKAEKALREALAQTEQEPEWYHGIDVYGCNRFYHKTEDRTSEFNTPLYTTPPQRKPLSDEEMKKIWYAMQNIMGWYSFQEIARAIEAAHGIKE